MVLGTETGIDNPILPPVYGSSSRGRTAIGWRQQKGKEGKEKGGREEREEREGEVGGGDGAGSPGVQFRL